MPKQGMSTGKISIIRTYQVMSSRTTTSEIISQNKIADSAANCIFIEHTYNTSLLSKHGKKIVTAIAKLLNL